MSFLYPRVISIARPNSTPTEDVGAASDIGAQGISAERGAPDESLILENLPASIQEDRQGQRNPVGLPTDAKYEPIYKIFIPKSAAALGQIKSRDVVIDELGIRYQVFAPVWDSLGYRLGAIVLEL